MRNNILKVIFIGVLTLILGITYISSISENEFMQRKIQE